MFNRREKELEKQLKDLQEKYDSIINDTRKANYELCQHEVDFVSINAFSIERCYNNETKQYYTMIGYIFNEQIKEWSFYCSIKEHNRLVENFKQYVSIKHTK